MRTSLFLIISFLASCISKGQNIRSIKISPKKITELKISSKNPCTVVCPFVFNNASITGGDITNNPAASPASFVLAYGIGGKVMDLKATSNEKRTTFMNIITKDNTVYVFKLIQDNKNFDSSVTLTDGKTQTINKQDYTPLRGSILLERSSIYDLLKKSDSNLINDSEYHHFNKDYKFLNSATLKIKEIIKWGNPHMLVFNGNFSSAKKLYYDRSSIIVKIGDKSFKASIFNGSGTIEPENTNPVQIGLSDVDYTEIRNIAVKNNSYNFALTFEEAPVEVEQRLLPDNGTSALLPEIPVNPAK